MEKLISLAQVEQLIDLTKLYVKLKGESIEWFNWTMTVAIFNELMDKFSDQVSSLPTEESGWIATDSWEFPQRLDPELVQCMSEYWPFLWVYEWDWVFVQQYTANRVKPSHWRKITPP